MRKIVFAALILGCTTMNALAADLATVNGKSITQSLMDYIVKSSIDAGKQVDDATRAGIIERLVMNEVLDQEALKAGVDKSADFQAKQSLMLHELRINAYLENYLNANPIDEKALQAEYEAQKALIKDKDYRVRHILVKTEDEAKEIISQLMKGADFANLAKDKSLDAGSKEKGGDLGWLSPDSVVKPFGDAMVKLEKGKYAQTATRTEFGWHIIQLDDIRETQPEPFDAVKDALKQSLQKEQLNKLFSDLKAKAKIVIHSSVKK